MTANKENRAGKKHRVVAAIGLAALLLAACGGEKGNPGGSGADGGSDPASKETPKPVTLYMLQDRATISDEEFANLIAAPVKAKYPHISVEMVRATGGVQGLSEMISAGTFPDLMFSTYPQIQVHKEMGTAENLSPYITKYKMDLNQFDPAAMQTSRIYGGSSTNVYAVPFSLNFLALFYNVELFDQFGVSYPTEGMTWDQMMELAKKFARSANGVDYRGIMIPGVTDLGTQLTLTRVDAKTNKALPDQEGWRTILKLIQDVNAIPGNKNSTLDHFLKTQSLAMLPSYDARFAALEKLYGTPDDFKWDITQFPSHPGKPNTTLASSGHFLLASTLGKHKEEVFQVIQLLTSEANQNLITEHGRFTGLSNETIKNKYGVNMKSMRGKSIKAVFKSSFAPPYQPTVYDELVHKELSAIAKKMIETGMDVNTALREVTEAGNRAIEADVKGK